MKRLATVLSFAVLVLAGCVQGAFAQTSGLPSRPNFQTVRASATGTALTSPILNRSTVPAVEVWETDGASNNQRWRAIANSEAFTLAAISDDGQTSGNIMVVQRTGTVIDSIDITGTAVSVNGVAAATNAAGSFTGTLTGYAVGPTGTVNYRIVGNVVTMWSDTTITGTSNAATLTMTGVPAAVRPTSPKVVTVQNMQDNGVSVVGSVLVNTGGSMNFTTHVISGTRLSATGTWTSSGTKGMDAGWSITYPLN